MKKSAQISIVFSLTLFLFFFAWCCKESVTEPQPPGNHGQPVEDTTRIYINPNTDDTLIIYPPAIFARFYPWATDTNFIKTIFDQYNLRRGIPVFINWYQQWVTLLYVTDNRRAEYHFTPYGKEGISNFGTDSLVEYSFGIFDEGDKYPFGHIIFKFADGTSLSKIDSLFEANGLRLLHTAPVYPSGLKYFTLITPKAEKNVLDLGLDLKILPFVTYCSVEMSMSGTGGTPFRCD